MAQFNFISPLVLIIIFTFVKDSHSFSSSSPYSDPELPVYSPEPTPDMDPEVPATPSYFPGPGADSGSYPKVPSSPAIPAPETYPSEPISPEPYPSAPIRHRFGRIKAAYWPSFNAFPASSIKTSYFTHIYYAFLLPEPNTYKLNVTQSDQTRIPELIHTLRAQKSSIKILLSIGGGGNDPDVFSKMSRNQETRAIFINSTIEIARKYGLDGLDLDWEFPANDQDMLNLGLLFRQWRKAINREFRISGNSPLLLTAAVYFASKFTTYGEPRSYPIDAINRYLNWVSPMCFDYHGSWENFTGLHAALYDPKSNISTSSGIGAWIEAGVPPRKLVMGLPLYGRTWKLQDRNVNGIGALALGVGPGDGVLTYKQIVDFNVENNAVVVFDGAPIGYFSYAGDSWIGYDGILSVKYKVLFAKSQGLGGYFFWALGQDKGWTLSRQASIEWDEGDK
ncbi:putative Chitinase [Melia azedarach]|uniref:Chitinase n=1 Tax=Melia azedarach TaxID=155640 RepID=A0ACC1X9C1_MELAZ|nr:putative Chitinase [Melia azedarach]